jgi:hypothetical protein
MHLRQIDNRNGHGTETVTENRNFHCIILNYNIIFYFIVIDSEILAMRLQF